MNPNTDPDNPRDRPGGLARVANKHSPRRANEALAQAVYADLVAVRKLPHDLEYITPPEIVKMILLCTQYHVDWSIGLVAGPDDGLRREFLVPVTNGPDQRFEVRSLRVRKEVMTQDFNNSVVPDGDITWAVIVIGQLRHAIQERLHAFAASRF